MNQFPERFPIELGKRLVYEHLVSPRPAIEGDHWEQIFADSIGGEWINSNVELDDIRLGNCAWSGKAAFVSKPSTAKRVRLISGRNNIRYSFGRSVTPADYPNDIGPLVLKIWNERVGVVRRLYQHLRTIVLLKSSDHTEFAVFEKDTVFYVPEAFNWEWNANENLIGFSKLDGLQYFTWQVNGQQFTIHEPVPQDRLSFRIRKPDAGDMERALAEIGFNESWVTII